MCMGESPSRVRIPPSPPHDARNWLIILRFWGATVCHRRVAISPAAEGRLRILPGRPPPTRWVGLAQPVPRRTLGACGRVSCRAWPNALPELDSATSTLGVFRASWSRKVLHNQRPSARWHREGVQGCWQRSRASPVAFHRKPLIAAGSSESSGSSRLGSSPPRPRSSLRNANRSLRLSALGPGACRNTRRREGSVH